MKKMKELRMRSVIKGITWRIIATCTTMSIVYVTTGNLELVGIVGAADIIIKLIFYYIHERAWGRVEWGKHVPRNV